MQVKPIFVNVGYGQKTEVQIGSQGTVTLVGDGVVDGFARRHLPEKDAITDIRDSRIETFIQAPEGRSLGAAWQAYSRRMQGGGYFFGANNGPYNTMQGVYVQDYKSQIGLLTRSFDEKGEVEHWIFANYDPETGKIQPETIRERIGGVNGHPALFFVESGGEDATLENQMKWSLWDSSQELR